MRKESFLPHGFFSRPKNKPVMAYIKYSKQIMTTRQESALRACPGCTRMESGVPRILYLYQNAAQTNSLVPNNQAYQLLTNCWLPNCWFEILGTQPLRTLGGVD